MGAASRNLGGGGRGRKCTAGLCVDTKRNPLLLLLLGTEARSSVAVHFPQLSNANSFFGATSLRYLKSSHSAVTLRPWLCMYSCGFGKGPIDSLKVTDLLLNTRLVIDECLKWRYSVPLTTQTRIYGLPPFSLTSISQREPLCCKINTHRHKNQLCQRITSSFSYFTAPFDKLMRNSRQI